MLIFILCIFGITSYNELYAYIFKAVESKNLMIYYVAKYGIFLRTVNVLYHKLSKRGLECSYIIQVIVR